MPENERVPRDEEVRDLIEAHPHVSRTERVLLAERALVRALLDGGFTVKGACCPWCGCFLHDRHDPGCPWSALVERSRLW